LYDDANFIITTADIKDAVTQLEGFGYSKWRSCATFLRDYDLAAESFSATFEFVEYAVATCILCHDSYMNPGKLFVRSIDLIITERCSLKCRDCSNLMQYYEKPMDCSLDELMDSMKSLFLLVDEINEIRVIGGEPFMNRDIHLILERLNNEPKIRRNVIYTNGTIIPSDLQISSLRNSKVLLIITNYGKLSKNLEALTRKLSDNYITFHTVPAGGWSDCSSISRHYRTSEEQKELFANCCAKNTFTLSAGRLYRCPFAANAARLSAIPDSPDVSVDLTISLIDQDGVTHKRNAIREFLLNREYIASCDYCSGRPFGAREIEPAIQLTVPLGYRAYAEHDRGDTD
jgi:organic radical activating enzyme